jgi:hypothetical protein
MVRNSRIAAAMATIAASAAARCRNTAAARGTRMSIATAIPPANGTQ